MKLRNLLNMGAGVLKARLLNRKAPLNTMLSVTNRCTSECVYCNIPSRKQRELTTEEIFDLIDQITRMGAQRLGLWGGEPLIRDDIGKIIDYAKNKGLYVTLDSNGYLVEEKSRFLKNLDHLILALDGPQEAHDANRGKGSFERVLKAIRSLKGRIAIWTITVLTKNNLDCVDFILRTAKDHGLLATFQVLHHNDILGRNHGSLLPSDKDYRRVIQEIILKKDKGAPIASSYSYLSHLFNWPDYKNPSLSYGIDGLKCRAGNCYCNVDTDGSVYPCSLMVGKMEALNYLDSGFRKAFLQMAGTACRSCSASCFTEYNYLYSLDRATIFEWLKAMRLSGSRRREAE